MPSGPPKHVVTCPAKLAAHCAPAPQNRANHTRSGASSTTGSGCGGTPVTRNTPGWRARRHAGHPGTRARWLHVEAELDHVAVLHDVVLALDAGLPRGPRGGDGTGGDQVFVGHDLGLDEAPLEVAVDHAGRFG